MDNFFSRGPVLDFSFSVPNIHNLFYYWNGKAIAFICWRIAQLVCQFRHQC